MIAVRCLAALLLAVPCAALSVGNSLSLRAPAAASLLATRSPSPVLSSERIQPPAVQPTRHGLELTSSFPPAAIRAARAVPRRSAIAPRSQRVVMAIEKPISVGVVGVTGAVGKEIIEVLGERGVPMSEIRLFASKRSAGKTMSTTLGDKTIEEFTLEEARKCDVVFLAVSGDFAEEWAEKLSAEGGPLVIDNSSAFRYDPRVALVVPEINAEAARRSKMRLIANPNCTTAIALMSLAPLHKLFTIKKCIMSTYQAASGAGAPGMDELQEGVRAMSAGEKVENEVFAHPLPFNVIPHIDKFLDDKYTKEERKVTWETRKILDVPDMPVSCTCVRIPTLRAHAEAITIETEKPIDLAAALAALEAAPGVVVVDDPANNLYPMPLTATSKYDVEVGRIRANDVFGDKGLDLFVCGDQLLRGAALNAVLIAEAVM
uniref:aspartate-semialdehyde dehydrogenase n=1 Tax=Coccolithus braarudii TaxID=221442 RepID=A0A7S0L8G2_9EUKA